MTYEVYAPPYKFDGKEVKQFSTYDEAVKFKRMLLDNYLILSTIRKVKDTK